MLAWLRLRSVIGMSDIPDKSWIVREIRRKERRFCIRQERPFSQDYTSKTSLAAKPTRKNSTRDLSIQSPLEILQHHNCSLSSHSNTISFNYCFGRCHRPDCCPLHPSPTHGWNICPPMPTDFSTAGTKQASAPTQKSF